MVKYANVEADDFQVSAEAYERVAGLNLLDLLSPPQQQQTAAARKRSHASFKKIERVSTPAQEAPRRHSWLDVERLSGMAAIVAGSNATDDSLRAALQLVAEPIKVSTLTIEKYKGVA